jgi:hypothetical protein
MSEQRLDELVAELAAARPVLDDVARARVGAVLQAACRAEAGGEGDADGDTDGVGDGGREGEGDADRDAAAALARANRRRWAVAAAAAAAVLVVVAFALRGGGRHSIVVVDAIPPAEIGELADGALLSAPRGATVQGQIHGASLTLYGPGWAARRADKIIVDADAFVVDRSPSAGSGTGTGTGSGTGSGSDAYRSAAAPTGDPPGRPAPAAPPIELQLRTATIHVQFATFSVYDSHPLQVTVLRGEILLSCAGAAKDRRVTAGTSATCGPVKTAAASPSVGAGGDAATGTPSPLPAVAADPIAAESAAGRAAATDPVGLAEDRAAATASQGSAANRTAPIVAPIVAPSSAANRTAPSSAPSAAPNRVAATASPDSSADRVGPGTQATSRAALAGSTAAAGGRAVAKPPPAPPGSAATSKPTRRPAGQPAAGAADRETDAAVTVEGVSAFPFAGSAAPPATPADANIGVAAPPPETAATGAAIGAATGAAVTPAERYAAAERLIARDAAAARAALRAMAAEAPEAPEAAPALLDLARLAAAAGDEAAAQAALTQLSAHPGAAALAMPAAYLRCTLEHTRDAYRMCLAAFRAAFPDSPRDAEVLAALAIATARGGACAAAAPLFAESTRRYPQGPKAADVRGWRAHCEAGK